MSCLWYYQHWKKQSTHSDLEDQLAWRLEQAQQQLQHQLIEKQALNVFEFEKQLNVQLDQALWLHRDFWQFVSNEWMRAELKEKIKKALREKYYDDRKANLKKFYRRIGAAT